MVVLNIRPVHMEDFDLVEDTDVGLHLQVLAEGCTDWDLEDTVVDPHIRPGNKIGFGLAGRPHKVLVVLVDVSLQEGHIVLAVVDIGLDQNRRKIVILPHILAEVDNLALLASMVHPRTDMAGQVVKNNFRLGDNLAGHTAAVDRTLLKAVMVDRNHISASRPCCRSQGQWRQVVISTAAKN